MPAGTAGGKVISIKRAVLDSTSRRSHKKPERSDNTDAGSADGIVGQMQKGKIVYFLHDRNMFFSGTVGTGFHWPGNLI